MQTAQIDQHDSENKNFDMSKEWRDLRKDEDPSAGRLNEE